MSEYRIREVDTENEAIRHVLNTLDQEILPLDFLTHKSGYWWIAYRDKKAVAFAGMCKSSQWSKVGYLCRAGTRTAHEGQGLQKRLIRVRAAKARKIGWTHLITDTHDNTISANNLIKMGFRLYEPKKPWSATGTLYFKLKL